MGEAFDELGEPMGEFGEPLNELSETLGELGEPLGELGELLCELGETLGCENSRHLPRRDQHSGASMWTVHCALCSPSPGGP